MPICSKGTTLTYLQEPEWLDDAFLLAHRYKACLALDLQQVIVSLQACFISTDDLTEKWLPG